MVSGLVNIRNPHSHRSGRRGRAGCALRSNAGGFLVEAVIAVLVVAIVSAALVSSFSRIRRVSTNSQTQLMATMLVQEIFDHLRAQSWTLIANNIGTHYAVVNDTGSATNDALFPRPLFRDASLSYYTPPVVNGQASRLDESDANKLFRAKDNTITVVLQSGSSNSTVNVTATVQWSDSTGSHTYSSTTMLAKMGLNG